jgi:hypothetical protein
MYRTGRETQLNPGRTGYKNASDKKKKICVAPKGSSSKKHPLKYRYLAP